ncbi:Hsp20/alpha crystallin family protein [Dactylosporangium vinaceum]|uniref:Hsp20/alpha crystallin family protein n=1 Tax=Dactylosporangium vinaceum TaxID=53362 RepID=A0ABV5MAH5_9ACTN|nr:Hsp20/alpha crystallin family protein [Dactylosporangium vinaceum]UAB92969.1 Hsp20/alpha crystallin family protein [Dactylosporangium vinaceum]
MSTTSRLFPLDLLQLPTALLGMQAVRVEEYTDGDTFVVRAEAPGLHPEKDITVSVFGNRLQIRLERTEERVDKAHSEFHYGTFTRTVALPLNAAEDGITATYVAGILEVRLPLTGTVTPGREIPVTTPKPSAAATAAKQK